MMAHPELFFPDGQQAQGDGEKVKELTSDLLAFLVRDGI